MVVYLNEFSEMNFLNVTVLKGMALPVNCIGILVMETWQIIFKSGRKFARLKKQRLLA